MKTSEAIARAKEFRGNAEAKRMAIEALERQEKYAWHDLRKNPDDLPAKYKVLIAYDLLSRTEYEVAYFGVPDGRKDKAFFRCDSEWGDVEIDKVIAWRYLEEFEEDNE